MTRGRAPASIFVYTRAHAHLAIVAIIPARFGSTRLPGKPLSDILGKPMIQHVYERASRARGLDRVLVATDDERIAAAVRAFGGEVKMTSPAHESGTDRLAEVARTLDATVVVNVQGDEPLLDPTGIEVAVAALQGDPEIAMATLSVPLLDVREMLSPSVVKVVVDQQGDALYFSRSPIPFVGPRRAAWRTRPGRRSGWESRASTWDSTSTGGRRSCASLLIPPRPWSEAEGLEQLRALHHGMRIRVAPSSGSGDALAVDTPEDLARVRSVLAVSPS